MTNCAKLRGLMVERQVDVTKLAKTLGISRQAASAKVNGKSKISLTDAQAISDILNMSQDERDLIFFATDVKCHTTNESPM